MKIIGRITLLTQYCSKITHIVANKMNMQKEMLWILKRCCLFEINSNNNRKLTIFKNEIIMNIIIIMIFIKQSPDCFVSKMTYKNSETSDIYSWPIMLFHCLQV